MSAGDYVVERFRLGGDYRCREPRGHGYLQQETPERGPAAILLDTFGGSIQLHALEEVSWRGSVEGDASRFVLAFLAGRPRDRDRCEDDRRDGHATFEIEGGFRGTALVPFGTLVLGEDRRRSARGQGHGSPSAAYEGTFFAKNVRIEPRVSVKKLETPFLIGALTVAKTSVCAGESNEVTLASAAKNATIRVQGVVGNHQFVQFANAPGPREIFATVVTADCGRRSSQAGTVACPRMRSTQAPRATPPPSDGMVGADAAPFASAPAVLKVGDCSGVLVSSRAFLTSAHCVDVGVTAAVLDGREVGVEAARSTRFIEAPRRTIWRSAGSQHRPRSLPSRSARHSPRWAPPCRSPATGSRDRSYAWSLRSAP